MPQGVKMDLRAFCAVAGVLYHCGSLSDNLIYSCIGFVIFDI